MGGVFVEWDGIDIIFVIEYDGGEGNVNIGFGDFDVLIGGVDVVVLV